MPDQSMFADRRKKLLNALPPHSIVIIESNHEVKRNADTCYVPRQDSNFYYLTGIEFEFNAILVLSSETNDAPAQYILFSPEKNRKNELWNGRVLGQEAILKDYQATQAFDIAEFDTKLPELLHNKEHLYYIRAQKSLTQKIDEALIANAQYAIFGLTKECAVHEALIPLSKMREIKDDYEIQKIREAVHASEKAHLQVMQDCKVGMNERDLSREFAFVCNKEGGTNELAYASIIGSYENTCILHYVKNSAPLKDGTLLLIDAAAEKELYAADITRTFPVNGTYSEAQRTIYEIVLKTQKTIIAAIKPGVILDDLILLSRKLLTEELHKIGILQGDLNQLLREAEDMYQQEGRELYKVKVLRAEQLLNQNSVRKFYPHGLGHGLGLDVHDPINKNAPLKPGMVFTIEPGIYITAEDNPNIDAKWHNIGVRIEDDILVTTDGCEVLSSHLPKEVAEIEASMRGEVPKAMKEIGYKRFNFFAEPTVTEKLDAYIKHWEEMANKM